MIGTAVSFVSFQIDPYHNHLNQDQSDNQCCVAFQWMSEGRICEGDYECGYRCQLANKLNVSVVFVIIPSLTLITVYHFIVCTKKTKYANVV